MRRHSLTEHTTGTRCRRRRTQATYFVAVLSALNIYARITPGLSFGGLKSQNKFTSTRTHGSNIAVYFQSVAGDLLPTNALNAFDAAFIPNDFFQVTTPRSLPIWLSFDRSHMFEENTHKLTRFLQDSYFTDDEIYQLKKTIIDASDGNYNTAAGATEFCLLLAETMEMGLHALAAGAIHYCASLKSLELRIGNAETTIGKSSVKANGLASFYGTQDIVADADRLKKLEEIASSVMQEQGSLRVSPNSRDAENVRHLLLTETKDWRALAIRTAASLFRLRGILSSKQINLTKESVRACREALSIYAPLASRLGMHRLKNELEGAAFRILYRRQYEAVNSLHQRRGGTSDNNSGQSMRNVLEEVKNEMAIMFGSDDEFDKQVESFEITARVKEPYSMWKKMLRLGYDHVLQVPDALAIRIVLKAKKLESDEPSEVTRARERALCYYAQKLCQERWRPYSANPRFKDYIGRPKKNGYQSLHYTAQTWWQGEPWTLEVQVRSAEMHQVAEIGLACHWDYKATQKRNKNLQDQYEATTDPDTDHSSDAYLRKVQQWHWMRHGVVTDNAEPVVISDSRERADRIRARTDRLRPYLQAFTTTQSDLSRDHVFVFLTTSNLEGSKVLSLPSGACVLDALREVERTMGIPSPNALVNGQETSITKQLHNGDILTLQSARVAVTA
jgi:GTP diphosphokinase / guanosine-3',5'-bis(diphosphate) 3'-diphosphatase